MSEGPEHGRDPDRRERDGPGPHDPAAPDAERQGSDDDRHESDKTPHEIEPNELGEWLRCDGPDADIALCTRVRLARNVEGFRFAAQMSDDEAVELERYLSGVLTAPGSVEELTRRPIREHSEIERQVLVERHLISRELAAAARECSVALNPDESVSIMVNEEDHLRAQIFRSGLGIDDAFERGQRIDEWLLGELPVAFSEEFGFLTSCPTNVGTGLRISVMLHLPGLVWADEIEKATNTVQKIHLAVRGMSGEGSQAVADLYQVSNQVTLGRTETQLRDDVKIAVERLVEWERDVREALLKGDSRERTLDRVYRALGTLKTARLLTGDECATCLSAVRFGVQQGLVTGIGYPQLHRALLVTQRFHMQHAFEDAETPARRDGRRAVLVREAFADARPTHGTSLA